MTPDVKFQISTMEEKMISLWMNSISLNRFRPIYEKIDLPIDFDEFIKQKMRLHICPSAGEGRSHYAMNPNCKPDSPDDMVLLFETKSGWNQNGGPELFNFDNHDPKGGCILLNDGTVKFIRTKEELNKLRWK